MPLRKINPNRCVYWIRAEASAGEERWPVEFGASGTRIDAAAAIARQNNLRLIEVVEANTAAGTCRDITLEITPMVDEAYMDADRDFHMRSYTPPAGRVRTVKREVA